MRPRCSKHDLAVGPDGRCALCRSEDAGSADLGDSAGLSPLVVTMVVLLALAACLVIVFGVKAFLLQPESIGRDDPTKAETRTAGDGPADVVRPQAAASAFAASQDKAGGDSAANAGSPHIEHRPLTRRDPRGLAPELRGRGEPDVAGEYRDGQESYELYVPAAAVAGAPRGILIWISSDPTGAFPIADWRGVLAKHQLAWAGANQAGNDREVSLRIGLALDALLDARQVFKVDLNRVYVGGLSGGAKSAFRALVYYPEVFQGALLAAGVEYFRELPAPSRGHGFRWPARLGKPRDLALAKSRPIAITTGPSDFNLGHITDVAAGMRQDGFSRLQIFSWQELGHAPPPTELFDRALTWIESATTGR